MGDGAAIGGCTLCTALLAVIIMAAVLLGTSIHQLSASQEGIWYNKLTKKLGPVETQGLHSGPPFSTLITFPAVYEPLNLSVTCVTNDGLFVTLNASFQYLPQLDALISIAKRFHDKNNYQTVVQTAAEAAIHETCSLFQISDFQFGRPLIQTSLSSVLEEYLQEVNATSLAAQLVNVGVPDDWNSAVYMKQQSQQDINLAENQRAQAIYQAQNNMSLALQDATITLQTAQANVTVIDVSAQQRADAIAATYDSFADIAVQLKTELSLSDDALLSMLTNRVVGTAGSSGVIDYAVQST